MKMPLHLRPSTHLEQLYDIAQLGAHACQQIRVFAAVHVAAFFVQQPPAAREMSEEVFGSSLKTPGYPLLVAPSNRYRWRCHSSQLTVS